MRPKYLPLVERGHLLPVLVAADVDLARRRVPVSRVRVADAVYGTAALIALSLLVPEGVVVVDGEYQVGEIARGLARRLPLCLLYTSPSPRD